MKVQELIDGLLAINATESIREFEIEAYDAEDERWRSVTGVMWDPIAEVVTIHTDEL